MGRTMTQYKWFWVWDFDKEEKWLNGMADSGWALKSVGFCKYTFEACEPGEYIVRLEMHDSDPSYVSFMEDTGAEYVGRVVKWIYFRRKSALGAFDLFSDIDSRIDHLKRIYRLAWLFGIMNLIIGVMNSFNASHFGWLNLLVCSLLMYGAGIMKGRMDMLAAERELRE